MAGWVGHVASLTDSGRFTHKVVTRPAISLAQDRESSPARTSGLTTMLRHQLKYKYNKIQTIFVRWMLTDFHCDEVINSCSYVFGHNYILNVLKQFGTPIPAENQLILSRMRWPNWYSPHSVTPWVT